MHLGQNINKNHKNNPYDRLSKNQKLKKNNIAKNKKILFKCFDITDRESFEHIRNWIKDKFAKEGVLRILVGNKCDLEHERQVK